MTWAQIVEAIAPETPYGALALALLAFGLNVADAMLTDAILARGGREKNRVMRWIMLCDLTRPFRWSIKLGVCVGYFWLAWPALWALALFAAPFAWVAWRNARARPLKLASIL